MSWLEFMNFLKLQESWWTPMYHPPGPTVASTTVPTGEGRSSCDNKEFGCCPDGTTPASSPEGANCPCKSKHLYKNPLSTLKLISPSISLISWYHPVFDAVCLCLLSVCTMHMTRYMQIHTVCSLLLWAVIFCIRLSLSLVLEDLRKPTL